MSAALPCSNMWSLLAIKSKGRVVKGIEQTWCRASKVCSGRWKICCYAATPLQYASAADSPPTTLPLPLAIAAWRGLTRINSVRLLKRVYWMLIKLYIQAKTEILKCFAAETVAERRRTTRLLYVCYVCRTFKTKAFYLAATKKNDSLFVAETAAQTSAMR